MIKNTACLPNMVAPSHQDCWVFEMWLVGLKKYNLNSFIWLVATLLDSAALKC